jgi:PKHD-type hydroxylase
MFLEIGDLLSGPEVLRLRAIADSSRFVDGRASNPHFILKNNQHQDLADPGYGESSRLVQAALERSEPFRNFAFPSQIAPPQLTRHGPGMAYGVHSDTAFMQLGSRLLRSDLSCTVFLSAPETYAGGELCIHLGTKPVQFKLPPGGAVIYPSNTLHEVRPVTQGLRLVSISFIESRIADPAQREMLYELGEVAALEGLNMQWQNRVRLGAVIQTLQRLWSQAG